MWTRAHLTATAGTVLLMGLAGCSGGDSSSEEGGSSGPPPCSDFSDGRVLTEELSLGGCEDEGVTVNESTVCTAAGEARSLFAVGPVYGFVGKPANYLGKGEDATESPEWEQFKQDCPYESE